SDCTHANCQSGLLCAAGTCKAVADVGAACGDAQPCKPNLQCATGKCQRPLGAGAACSPQAAAGADVLACDATQRLSCVGVGAGAVAASGTCPPIRYADVGQSCGLDPASKQLVSCAGSSCSSDAGGTCVADGKEGDDCASDGPPCEVPLSCIDGRCGR